MAVIANASSLLFRADSISKDPKLSFHLFVYPSHFLGAALHPDKGVLYLRQYDKRPEVEASLQTNSILEDLKSEWNDFLHTYVEVVKAGAARLSASSSNGKELFPGCRFVAGNEHHPHFSWLQSAIDKNWQSGVYVEFSGSRLAAFVKKDSGIVFYNQFDIRGSKDALYFILLIYKQLNLNKESFPLFVGGAVSAESEVMNWLKKYVREVSLFNGPKVIKNWPFEQHDVAWHLYPSLICHLTCA